MRIKKFDVVKLRNKNKAIILKKYKGEYLVKILVKNKENIITIKETEIVTILYSQNKKR